MDQFGFLLALWEIAALVGIIMAGSLFVVLSLAPQKKFRQIPVIILFILIELDFIALWFIALFLLAGGMTSNFALYTSFAVLLFGLCAPVSWIVYARVGIARQKIRPVILSLEKLELGQ